IKCTSKGSIRITPTQGFLEPGETVTVKISLKGNGIPDNGKHHFSFLHTRSDKTTDADKSYKQIWSDATKVGRCEESCEFEITQEKKEENNPKTQKTVEQTK
ncbi:hypothetical protein PMAYCL1PPCAC_24404, partial [Pristionchus mayeri]